MVTTIIWDQTDDRGNRVEPGEYFAAIALPKTVNISATDDPSKKLSYEIPTSLQTSFPIVIH